MFSQILEDLERTQTIISAPAGLWLARYIDEAFEIFSDKSEYVVAAPQYRAAAA